MGRLPGNALSWRVSDALWAQLAPLVPISARPPGRTYLRKPGAGRPPMAPRRVFEGIVFVLRTGLPWKALPKGEFGSPSAVHAHFQKWEEAGFFAALWKAGLAECDELQGIAWSWRGPRESLAQASKSPGACRPPEKVARRGPSPERLVWGPAIARRRS